MEKPITNEDILKTVVPIEVKKNCLASAIWAFTNKQMFFGGLLQEMDIKYNAFTKTASIHFDAKAAVLEMQLNPNFFCSLDLEGRVTILHHEMLHFACGHLESRYKSKMIDYTGSREFNDEINIPNIAADMAINQLIEHKLPGMVDVNNFIVDNTDTEFTIEVGDNLTFERNQTFEFYYELLMKTKNNKGIKKELDKYTPFDDHDGWGELSEEQKKKYLAEAEKLIKRTIEKSGNRHSSIPSSIQDFLKEIDANKAALDYKGILRNTIRKTVTHTDKIDNWHRPNKRYGMYAPSEKDDYLPLLNFYNDSSGSMSLIEVNECMRIMDGFLLAGSRRCYFAFWHTSLYYKEKYRRGQIIEETVFQAGGTDVTCVLEDIKKCNPNLSIILTDGCYDASPIEPKSEIIWIITSGGSKDHPMSHVGKTIYLDNLKAA